MKYAIEIDGGQAALIEVPGEIEETALVLTGAVARVEDDFDPASISDFHFDAGRFRRKPPSGIKIDKTHVNADLVDVAVVTGVPAGATVMTSVEVRSCCPARTRVFRVDDGVAELAFSEPGDYTVKVLSQGARPWEVVVHAL